MRKFESTKIFQLVYANRWKDDDFLFLRKIHKYSQYLDELFTNFNQKPNHFLLKSPTQGQGASLFVKPFEKQLTTRVLRRHQPERMTVELVGELGGGQTFRPEGPLRAVTRLQELHGVREMRMPLTQGLPPTFRGTFQLPSCGQSFAEALDALGRRRWEQGAGDILLEPRRSFCSHRSPTWFDRRGLGVAVARGVRLRTRRAALANHLIVRSSGHVQTGLRRRHETASAVVDSRGVTTVRRRCGVGGRFRSGTGHRQPLHGNQLRLESEEGIGK